MASVTTVRAWQVWLPQRRFQTVAEVRERIEVAGYEQAIQTAFREVADALAARGTYGDQLEAQRSLTNAYADSYLAVLDSQRELYSAQQSLITLQRDQLTSQVTLFKVLGGGRQDQASSPARL